MAPLVAAGAAVRLTLSTARSLRPPGSKVRSNPPPSAPESPIAVAPYPTPSRRGARGSWALAGALTTGVFGRKLVRPQRDALLW